MAAKATPAERRLDRLPFAALNANGLREDLIEPDNTTAIVQDEKVPDLLPPFNIQVALARANGKPRLLRRMMLRFGVIYAQAGPELRKMIADGKLEEAYRFAHSLKGVAATLEAQQLALCAAAIEHALRDGRMEGIFELIRTMEAALVPAIDSATSLEKSICVIRPAGDLR
jgi:HPt (histidine-containing phosphotransfer) domain-containing protein